MSCVVVIAVCNDNHNNDDDDNDNVNGNGIGMRCKEAVAYLVSMILSDFYSNGLLQYILGDGGQVDHHKSKWMMSE